MLFTLMSHVQPSGDQHEVTLHTFVLVAVKMTSFVVHFNLLNLTLSFREKGNLVLWEHYCIIYYPALYLDITTLTLTLT